MPFMPAVRLNQREWSVTEAGSAFLGRGFSSGSLSSFFLFSRCSAVQSFGPLNVCCPNASESRWCSVKLLSAGAGSKTW